MVKDNIHTNVCNSKQFRSETAVRMIAPHVTYFDILKTRMSIRSENNTLNKLPTIKSDHDTIIRPKTSAPTYRPSFTPDEHVLPSIETPNIIKESYTKLPSIAKNNSVQELGPINDVADVTSGFGEEGPSSHRTGRRKSSLTTETNKVESETDEDGETTSLNQYIVGHEIGHGAFGIVKLCIDRNTNQRYALKMLSKRRLRRKRHLGQKTNALDDVRREIAILKKLEHPNVVNLVEVMDDPRNDTLCLVFEIVENGMVMEVGEVRSTDPLKEDDAHRWFCELLLGVEYCHHQGVIHRDIKPANLLLSRDNVLKIADFGVSHICEDGDNIKKSAGSPAFLAPEVVAMDSSNPYNGKIVDIWAMGITLYCFAYGKVPFMSSSILELYELITSEPIKHPPNASVSSELRHLIDQLLIKDPKERISLKQLREHPWITRNGQHQLISEETNTLFEEVTTQEIETAVKPIISLSTLILIKGMGRRRSLTLPPQKILVSSNPDLPVSEECPDFVEHRSEGDLTINVQAEEKEDEVNPMESEKNDDKNWTPPRITRCSSRRSQIDLNISRQF